eukprot:351760-Chlamydomonas_euryale.AAC.1
MIALTDLESDNINPFDCASRVNRLVTVETAAQGVLTLLLLAGGRWLLAAIHVAVCLLLAHMFWRGQVYMHAADAFKQLVVLKQRRFVIFGVYCFCFLLATYR